MSRRVGVRVPFSSEGVRKIPLKERLPAFVTVPALSDLRSVLPVLLLVAGFALGTPLRAAPAMVQSGDSRVTGEIRGQVVDATDGSHLDGTVVVLDGTDRSTLTNRAGEFRFTGLAEGAYSVVVTRIGFEAHREVVSVATGEVARLEIRMISAVLLGEGLVVEARRHRRARALGEQFESDRIANMLSAEQIADNTDTNLAEALQRVPGITMDDASDEGGVVSMRGLPAAFTTVLINGQRMPSISSTGRGTVVGIINAEAVESIEVMKAVTPDMDAESTGGAINMRTRRFSGGGRIFRIGGEGGMHHAEQQLPSFNASGVWGDQVGRVGLIIDGSIRRTNPYSNELNTGGWFNAEIGGEQVRLPGQVRQNFHSAARTRYTLNATADFDAAEHSRLHVRASVNETRDFRTNAQYRFNRLQFADPNTVASARGEHYGRFYDYSFHMNSLSAGGEHQLGRALLDWSGTLARAGSAAPYIRATFRRDGLAFGYRNEEGLFPILEASGSQNEFDPSTYRMIDLRTRNDRDRDADRSLNLNFELPFQLSGESHSLKFGSRYGSRDKMRQRDYDRWEGFDANIPMSVFSNGEANYDFLRGRYAFGPRLDRGLTDRFIAENLDQLVLNENYARAATDVNSYRAAEEIGAAFGMATVNVGRVRMVGGVRWERTDIQYEGNEVIYDMRGNYVSTSPLSAQQGYDGFFPSLQTRILLGSTSTLRLAATRTMARPSFYDLVPYEEVNPDNGIINRGNPELRPSFIRNLDASIERYLPSQAGLVSLGVFHKDVDSYITEQLFIETEGQWAGFPVRRPVNGLDATVWGVEATWVQDLSFLPGALAGLGVSTNYTFTDSEADYGEDVRQLVIGDRSIPIPGMSRHMANVAVSWSQGGFFANLSNNYRSEYLTSVGNAADGSTDEYMSGRSRLDLKVRQDFSERFLRLGSGALTLEATNLLDSDYRRFVGDRDQVSRLRTSFRTVRLGFVIDL
ncbi:MAG: TonB-dependent receptor [Gemmatimonadales bacterium]|nr:MAG: TonB-dependent receptor [Gemmatimonadales bacterium]